MSLPEIPNSWLVLALLIGLVTMRTFGIDSFTTAALSLVIGFITGKQLERGIKPAQFEQSATTGQEPEEASQPTNKAS